MRLIAEIEVPDDALAVRLRIEQLCRENAWELVALDRAQSHPECPNCGMPMLWSRELQAFSCSHPE